VVVLNYAALVVFPNLKQKGGHKTHPYRDYLERSNALLGAIASFLGFLLAVNKVCINHIILVASRRAIG